MLYSEPPQFWDERLPQNPSIEQERLNQEVVGFGEHIAGSRMTAACLLDAYTLRSTSSRKMTRALLVIEDFQPRLMNYGKTLGKNTLSALAVDKWVFERDVDRGLLGEALAGGLIFQYEPLINQEYLHSNEVILKKRLILELLHSLVLDFPELSCEFHVRPEYFFYKTLQTRIRLFPPMYDSLLNLVKDSEGFQQALQGFLEALENLKDEGVVSFSRQYVTISKEFIEKACASKFRFTNLFKTGHRALFASLVGMLPQIVNAFSQNNASGFGLQRILTQGANTRFPLEDPDAYVYLKTSRGLAPLANRMDIAAVSRKILHASPHTEISIRNLGGILNDVYLVSACIEGIEKKVVVKRFRDWSNFKWFPLTLWSVGTKTFAVLGDSRLQKECAINHLLHSHGFAVPEILYVSPNGRLIFTEYIAGENLSIIIRKAVDSKNSGESKRGLELIESAGELFAKVHALGVALGDAKPENILVSVKGEFFLTDLEQAGRNEDKTWDIAEFLYYLGHDISPFANTRRIELLADTFIKGYLNGGGNTQTVKNAANPKYTKVFSIFTFPHIMLAISNRCRNADKMPK